MTYPKMLRIGLLGLAGMFSASSALAETAEEAAAIFGARETTLDVSLSPSGDKFAYIAPGGYSTEVLYVVDMAAGDGTPKPIIYLDDPSQELTYCNWANEERLVCQIFITANVEGRLLTFTRLFSIGADGGETVVLTVRDSMRALNIRQNGGSILALDYQGEDNKILMTREWVKEATTGTRLANNDEGLGVDRVDVSDGKRRKVEAPDPDVRSYIADETGRIRLKVRQPDDLTGNLRNKRLYYYRSADSDRWRELEKSVVTAQGSTGFTPAAVDSALNIAYGFENRNGYTGLYSIALDGSEEKKQVLAHEGADIDQLIRIGRQRRVVGASYATEKREIAYIDADLAKLASQLQAALPGQPLVNIVDASADESKLLIIASSDTDPGIVYMLDRATNGLTEILALRNNLLERPMAVMKPVSFPAGDGTQIPAYLTMPLGAELGTEGPVRAIVMPHGGPSARDEWGFDWLVQYFASRGYAVLQPNYRGSNGYGSDWFGRNGFQAWNVAVGDVNDAGRWLISEGITAPDKLAAFGWSYGGYAVLQSQVLDPQLYKAIVAVAPVTNLNSVKEEARGFTNYALVSDFIGNGPHVNEGSPAQNIDAFAAPVLLFHGSDDLNVGVGQSRMLKNRLEDAGKPVEYVEYEGRDHYLDDDWARSNMLMMAEAFLAEHLGQ